MEGPESKAWVLGDSGPFAVERDGEFRPRRWIERAGFSIWLRAPYPAKPELEVKGTWLSNHGREYKVDPDKADRHLTMYERGHA
jgi:hypothetical protein